MRVLLQKVASAKVTVADELIGEINQGFLLYVGFTHEDTLQKAQALAEKISKLRVFADENDKLNLNIFQAEGSILSVSQFTLYGSTKKGNRPSFTDAMLPADAEKLYQGFNNHLRKLGLRVATGSFGAHMAVSSVNDGPVTFWLEN